MIPAPGLSVRHTINMIAVVKTTGKPPVDDAARRLKHFLSASNAAVIAQCVTV